MSINFKFILGIIGNIIAICLFTSPLRTFWDIVKKKDVQEYSGIPYVCTLLNCMLWVVYGMPDVQLQVLVVTINAAGCMIETGYLTTYLIFAPKRLRMKVLKLLAIVAVGFVFVVVLILELVHDKTRRKLIIGTLCVVFAVGMYASPLTIMRMVIRTHSVEFMPFLLSLFNFLNGLVWFGYAFVGGLDIFIAIPNGIGALLGLAQLALYAFYKNATPARMERAGKADESKLGTGMEAISIDLAHDHHHHHHGETCTATPIKQSGPLLPNTTLPHHTQGSH
ncbi:hypothetical protein BDL97_13G127300 [Sphagnum fallax]|nr:hypothetical protein BDL97_13G127300 [Sphagnum fallax]